MLTVLIIRGATLSGAIEGVKFYMGTVDFAALKNPSVWFIEYLEKRFFCIRFF
jgi:SNF family Na+-dependent transporter